MTTAVKYMTCEEKVEAEKARLVAILLKRGALFEDEQERYNLCVEILQWFRDDREESDRIELEAMMAEEEAEKNDPNYKTRQMFKNVKIKVPLKER